MTAAAAAKMVKRTVVVEENGAKTQKKVAVGADEVLSFRDYGSRVVVVTKDGQKFSSAEA
jgi:hypothetical protein